MAEADDYQPSDGCEGAIARLMDDACLGYDADGLDGAAYKLCDALGRVDAEDRQALLDMLNAVDRDHGWLGEPIAHGLWALADHLDGHKFGDGARKAIVLAARGVIEAVGEHDDCPHCDDGGVLEDEAENKVVECSVCYGTNRALPGDVHAVIDREREVAEEWRRKFAELAECSGQQHIGEVAR